MDEIAPPIRGSVMTRACCTGWEALFYRFQSRNKPVVGTSTLQHSGLTSRDAFSGLTYIWNHHCGFSGEPGDRGDTALASDGRRRLGHCLFEWSWIHRCLQGLDSSPHTGSCPSTNFHPGGEATHRHLRQVDWVHAVASSVYAQYLPKKLVAKHHARQRNYCQRRRSSSRSASARSAVIPSSHAKLSRTYLVHSLQTLSSLRVTHQTRGTSGCGSRRNNRNEFPFLRTNFCATRRGGRGSLPREWWRGRCNSEAPFIRRTNGSPYLEVHHKTPLAEDGEDTVENAIALCPNCHRELH